MVTPGGEVDFILRTLQESLKLRDKVKWYTTMFGMLNSVSVFVENLKALENHNYAVTEFVQGTKTKRWAVAWSWTDWRPAMVRLTRRHNFIQNPWNILC
jgi:23S rRNA (adenine1618-N6)-methyltransferase